MTSGKWMGSRRLLERDVANSKRRYGRYQTIPLIDLSSVNARLNFIAKFGAGTNRYSVPTDKGSPAWFVKMYPFRVEIYAPGERASRCSSTLLRPSTGNHQPVALPTPHSTTAKRAGTCQTDSTMAGEVVAGL